jgi:hypothetical protein
MSADATIQDVLERRSEWALIHGRCEDFLPSLPDRCVDHCVEDPPYSKHVHGKQRRMLRGAGGRTADGQRSGRGQVGPAALGFDALSAETRLAVATQLGRLVRRWSLNFSDAESVHLWREDLERAGLQHVREGAWIKVAGQPQLTGDRPAVGFEAIQISHGPTRKRWNNGGHPAVWWFPIATDRNQTGFRIHTTQKPIELMEKLIKDFTDPGDLVLDGFAGSGTTGAACIRQGRRFIGFEVDADYATKARERLAREVLSPVVFGVGKIKQAGLGL